MWNRQRLIGRRVTRPDQTAGCLLEIPLSSGVMATKRYGAGPRHWITSPVKLHFLCPIIEMRHTPGARLHAACGAYPG